MTFSDRLTEDLKKPGTLPMTAERPVAEQAMPLSSDLRSVFQGGLFVLALLAAL